MSDNEIKAKAVMEFVDLMIGAFESGFVYNNNTTLSQIHRVAENHCNDMLGVKIDSIVERWGKETAIDCGLELKTNQSNG